jgi:hypothetical protein
MIANPRLDAGRFRAPADDTVGVLLEEGIAGQLAGLAAGAAEEIAVDIIGDAGRLDIGVTTPKVKNSTLSVGREIRWHQVTAGSWSSGGRIGGPPYWNMAFKSTTSRFAKVQAVVHKFVTDRLSRLDPRNNFLVVG